MSESEVLHVKNVRGCWTFLLRWKFVRRSRNNHMNTSLQCRWIFVRIRQCNSISKFIFYWILILVYMNEFQIPLESIFCFFLRKSVNEVSIEELGDTSNHSLLMIGMIGKTFYSIFLFHKYSYNNFLILEWPISIRTIPYALQMNLNSARMCSSCTECTETVKTAWQQKFRRNSNEKIINFL